MDRSLFLNFEYCLVSCDSDVHLSEICLHLCFKVEHDNLVQTTKLLLLNFRWIFNKPLLLCVDISVPQQRILMDKTE